MKHSKLAATILMGICLMSGSHALAQNDFDKTESVIVSYLQDSLNLTKGPATRYSKFYIPGTGYFIVVQCDMSFSKSKSTPFGAPKSEKSSRKKQAPSVTDAMKQALASAAASIPLKGSETVFLVVIDKKMYESPFEKVQKETSYKVSINLNELGSPDLLSKIKSY